MPVRRTTDPLEFRTPQGIVFDDFVNQFGAFDLNTGNVVDEVDDDQVEEQVEPTWIPRRFDLARVIDAHDGLVVGEIVIIDEVGYTGGCREEDCGPCSVLDVYMIRPSRHSLGDDWEEHYNRTRTHRVEPLRPVPGEVCLVRCSSAAASHQGNHRCTARCTLPVQVRDGYAGSVTTLGPLNRDLPAFAELLERHEQERQLRRDRIAMITVGQTYLLDQAGGSLHGFLVEITGPRRIDGNFPCNILYNTGDLYRSATRIDPMSLGEVVHAWSRRTMAPSFIQFNDSQAYSGISAVSDREVIDLGDEHECDHVCFEYGCTLGESYESDEEPEDYIDDVPMMPYSYTPNLIFSGAGPVYLGMELELSCGNDYDADHKMRSAVRTLRGSNLERLVYLKSDSSIQGRGFEAVFHPMSYDWVLENWPADLLGRMRADGARPHSSCGMHVHVSRSGFSDPSHAYKWIKFVYRNAREMSRMARRDPSSWGSFGAVRERAAAKWYAKGGYGGEQRYVAVNCIPRNTFEVRIFASTLNHSRLLGSLGLVDASVEYARQLTIKNIVEQDGWSFAPFREWVHSFKKYAPLQKEMVRLLDK